MKKELFLFVTVGSTDFDDLIKAVDNLVPKLETKGIMQIGNGKYKPVNLKFFRFKETLEPFYKKATLAVAHGGLGTTIELLKHRIPLVSISNPDRFDKHQDDLLKAMEDEGYLVWCKRLKDLEQSIHLAQINNFRIYETPKCKIHYVINEYLNKI